MLITTSSRVKVRLLQPNDSYADLTRLLRRAYAQLAAAGFNYTASYQDEATTRHRCGRGECYVAELDRQMVGTVTLRSGPSKGSPWLEQNGVASFEQFGVEPTLQRQGIGSKLMDAIERRAAEKGFHDMALHTAEGAEHLIRWYTSRGYGFIEHLHWPGKIYRSVVLSKNLAT